MTSRWRAHSGDEAIIERLNRIVELLERPQPFAPSPPSSYEPDRCLMCGGYHGGMPCPALTPMAKAQTKP